MKKLMLPVVLLALATAAHAQDYCKQVKKEVSEDKTQYEYASPYNPEQLPNVRVTRNISTNAEFPYDNFYIVFQVPIELDEVYAKGADGTQEEKVEKAMMVEFDDKSRIADDTISVLHEYTDDRSMAMKSVYYPVSEKTAQEFATKKILKFTLAGKEKIMTNADATAAMQYIKCIKEAKH